MQGRQGFQFDIGFVHDDEQNKLKGVKLQNGKQTSVNMRHDLNTRLE